MSSEYYRYKIYYKGIFNDSKLKNTLKPQLQLILSMLWLISCHIKKSQMVNKSQNHYIAYLVLPVVLMTRSSKT